MRLFAKTSRPSGSALALVPSGPAVAVAEGTMTELPRVDADADVLVMIDADRLDDALRVVMRRHGDGIFRYCVGQLGDEMLAEDVQQQVFIHAHRDFRRFARRSSLKTWLFGI